jgi:translation initiation factor IF-2
VGDITESDVLLAEASQAVIIGFHVLVTGKARDLAQREDVDIRMYKVIYDVVNDVKLALAGLLEPIVSEQVVGTAEVRNIFRASKVGVIAGCYVLTGKIVRNSLLRVLREGKVVHQGKLSSLKRFKDDAREVAAGFECGITLEAYEGLNVGDTLEAYQLVETARTL